MSSNKRNVPLRQNNESDWNILSKISWMERGKYLKVCGDGFFNFPVSYMQAYIMPL